METIGCLLPNTLVRLGPKRIGWSFVPPPIYCQQSCICVFLKNASSIQRSNPYNFQHSGLPLGMVNRGLHFAKRASCIHTSFVPLIHIYILCFEKSAFYWMAGLISFIYIRKLKNIGFCIVWLHCDLDCRPLLYIFFALFLCYIHILMAKHQ